MFRPSSDCFSVSLFCLQLVCACQSPSTRASICKSPIVCLSACHSVCMPINISLHKSVCFSIYLSIYSLQSACLSTSLFDCLSIFLPVCRPPCLTACMPACLSVYNRPVRPSSCLYVYLSASVYVCKTVTYSIPLTYLQIN